MRVAPDPDVGRPDPTPRQREAIRWFVAGYTMGQIAKKMGVSCERVSRLLYRPLRNTPVDDHPATRARTIRVQQLARRLHRRPDLRTLGDLARVLRVASRYTVSGWLRRAGVYETVTAQLRKHRQEAEKFRVLAGVRRMARTLGRTPTQLECVAQGVAFPETVVRLFGSYRAMQQAAGLVPNKQGGGTAHLRRRRPQTDDR